MEGLFTVGCVRTVVESVVFFVGQICIWVNLFELWLCFCFGEDIRVVASGEYIVAQLARQLKPGPACTD